MQYTEEEGDLAVRVAREALEAHVARRTMRSFVVPARFEAKAGAFVTLSLHPSGGLRGCIGYPEPFFPLLKSIVKAAEGSAEDPRFPTLREEELTGVAVEVSLLTPPQVIEVRKPKELPKLVRVGEDGLIVAQGPYRGLLLPQVAIEERWGPEDFLAETCIKAGLLADAWLDESTRVKKFQAEIFAEVEPRGAVVRRSLGGTDARR
ncbi:MAG: hypothetical protein A3K59_07855 [Euryarchaeota archaeon RBG_19FT_COMBO_69_17]|nr:MAG: hypothetical protein A3K59_07855 [Euryarchaeota archaeon RBG_19FT_COMBO_69_17]